MTLPLASTLMKVYTSFFSYALASPSHLLDALLPLLPYGIYTAHLFRTPLVRFYSFTGFLGMASPFCPFPSLPSALTAPFSSYSASPTPSVPPSKARAPIWAKAPSSTKMGLASPPYPIQALTSPSPPSPSLPIHLYQCPLYPRPTQLFRRHLLPLPFSPVLSHPLFLLPLSPPSTPT
jgi:hypothetical protein